MPESYSDYDVVFRSAALAPGDLRVRRLSGRESISQLFEFELILETTFGGALEQDQIDALLSSPAYFAFGESDEHKYHGVVRQLEMFSMSDPSPVVYRARFVPKFFDTSLTFGSWVYQDMNVQKMVTDVLTEAGFIEGDDFEWRLTATYPSREYVVQYQETDLNFILRHLEHWGICFWFEHGDERAKIVFADGNNAFTPLEGFETISYDPRMGMTDHGESVTSLSLVQTVIPKQMKLRDYNYRTPSVALISEADIDADGVGNQVYYGDHFKDLGEGRRLANVRAQEILAQKVVGNGRTRVRGLRAGHVFTLENHMLSSLDQRYLVTAVEHHVSQPGASAAAGSETQGYFNEIQVIPSAVQYRPARVTPRPRIVGVIHGKVDAGGDDGVSAPIDEHGRYKVLLPFDIDGASGGRASRWIRMSQPSAGGGYGVHYPLHVGTEVAITHVDGDPDRPLILGAVPNYETISPSTGSNPTQSVTRTRTGITVTFDDSPA